MSDIGFIHPRSYVPLIFVAAYADYCATELLGTCQI
jgi:hypothetical protein